MGIKLVAADMDGTLLNSRKELPADFIPWVKAHPAIKTVIASGRQYQTLRHEFSELADQLVIIAENGGFVYDGGRLIISNPMEYADIAAVLKSIEGYSGIHPVICGRRSAYMHPGSGRAQSETRKFFLDLEFTDDLYSAAKNDEVVKIALFIDGFAAAELGPTLKSPADNLTFTVSAPEWIDVADKRVNKGAAIIKLQQHLGLDRSECMAFGDFMNDYTMILACGESYCMENGHPDLKVAAKYIAASNDDDGVMRVLRTL